MASLLTTQNIWYILQRFAQKYSIQKYTQTDFNNHINMASLEHFKNVYGRPSEQEGYESEPQITDALLPFKTSSTVSLTTGEGTIPTDYFHVRSVYHNSGSDRIKIKQVTDNEWDYYHDNSLYLPTERDPVWSFKNSTTLRVSPNSIAQIQFFYLKRPSEAGIQMGITDDVMAYDGVNSTDLEWDDDQVIDIIRIMLGYLSIEAGRGEILSYVEQKENQEA